MASRIDVALDTSVVIQHFRGNSLLLRRLSELRNVYLPRVALGELYAGAYRSAQPEKNLAQIRNLLESMRLLPALPETPSTYGQLSADVAKLGTPIPQNDLWIAAEALSNRLPLITLDLHFKVVPRIEMVFW